MWFPHGHSDLRAPSRYLCKNPPLVFTSKTLSAYSSPTSSFTVIIISFCSKVNMWFKEDISVWSTFAQSYNPAICVQHVHMKIALLLYFSEVLVLLLVNNIFTMKIICSWSCFSWMYVRWALFWIGCNKSGFVGIDRHLKGCVQIKIETDIAHILLLMCSTKLKLDMGICMCEHVLNWLQ